VRLPRDVRRAFAEAEEAMLTDDEIDEEAVSLSNRDRLVRDALTRLVPGYHHVYTNGRPNPPDASDYAEAQALATIAIAIALGELTAEVRRLNESTERQTDTQPPPDP
jgi:hypothetical protein